MATGTCCKEKKQEFIPSGRIKTMVSEKVLIDTLNTVHRANTMRLIENVFFGMSQYRPTYYIVFLETNNKDKYT